MRCGRSLKCVGWRSDNESVPFFGQLIDSDRLAVGLHVACNDVIADPCSADMKLNGNLIGQALIFLARKADSVAQSGAG